MSHEAAAGAAAYPLFVFFMFFVFFGIVAATYQYTMPVYACPPSSAPPRPAAYAYMQVPDGQESGPVYQPVAGVGGAPGGSGYQMMPGPGTCQAQRSMPERAEVYQRLMTGVTPASFFKLS